jgi:NAD-dependent deacetylase
MRKHPVPGRYICHLRGLIAHGEDGNVTHDGPAETALAPEWAHGVRTVAVLTGAGISTDSGIPDFRGPQGIWTTNPAAEKLSTYQAYMSDPELRRRSWQNRLAHPAWAAEPNPAHRALARLAGSAIDTQVITQNIDGLHQRAGTPHERVIELHGTMYAVVCTCCRERTEMAAALDRVRAGEADPPCVRCGGILKSATVMFGQALDPGVFDRAAAAATYCDLFLAVGSTLTVEPAASLCAVAAEAGASLVIINRDPTPYDRAATAVIRDPIGEAVPRVADQLLQLQPT